MAKRIAFCADGTWDDSTKHTNVYKLFNSLAVSADQMPFYDPGVGADGNPITRLLGGAFGTGLWQKIKDGYTKIAHVYEAGDSIFIFGFSRGAYTARSLAGMISVCGLPTKNFSDQMVDIAFSAYRDKDDRQKLLGQLQDYGMFDAPITMVGVWDTVGALGIPSVFGAVDPIAYGFLDTGLNPKVQNAYHAVAIDEKRAEFPATLWTSPPAPGQTLEQIWFSGVHSDVGGGEPEEGPGTTALSDITLSWMMSKAAALGLKINPAVQAQYTVPLDPKYALDTLHTSWNIGWGFPRPRSVDKNAVLSNSVLIRCQHDNTYRPSNLIFENNALAGGYRSSAILNLPEMVQAAGH